MNKAELIDAVAAKTSTDKKSTGAVIETMVDTVLRAVATGERVAITGFGVFEKRERAARTARNPRTGVAIRLKKTSVPAFRPGQGFKDVVSGVKRLTKNTTAKRSSSAAATTKAAPAKKAVTAKKAAPAKKVATAKKAAPAKKVATAKKAAPAKRVAAKVLATKAPATKAATKKVAAKTLAKKSGRKAKK